MRSFNILFFLFGDQIFAPFANHFNFFSLKHFTNTVFAVKSAMLFVNDKIKKRFFMTSMTSLIFMRHVYIKSGKLILCNLIVE